MTIDEIIKKSNLEEILFKLENLKKRKNDLKNQISDIETDEFALRAARDHFIDHQNRQKKIY